MNRILVNLVLILTATWVATHQASAIQESDIVEDPELKSVLAKLDTLIESNDLEAASKWMTKKAVDSFCADNIIIAQQMIEEDFEPDTTEALRAIMDNFDLKKIELPAAFTDPNAEFPTEEEFEKLSKSILKLVPEEKRIKVATALLEAMGDEMGGSPFSGKVTACEIDGKKASVGVDIDMEMVMEDEDGNEVEMEPEDGAAFTIYSNFVKTDGGWKWDGIDEEKMESMMFEEMGGLESLPLIENFTLQGKSVDGKSINLKDYRGKVVLVDFWGTWCGPCIASLPELEKLHKVLKEFGFEIIGVAADDGETLKEFFDSETKLPWQNIVDGEYAISEKYGVEAFPTTLIIDKEGKHVASDVGGQALFELLIEQLGLDADDSEKARKNWSALNSKKDE